MPIDAINASLSGMYAASQQIAVSANNIANAGSTSTSVNGKSVNQPYVPQQVNQQSAPTGGVSTSLSDISPASFNVFGADGQLIATPNVDLSGEVAKQTLAANTYKANAAVIRRENEAFQSLLDINS